MREIRVRVRILLPELIYKIRVWLVLIYRKIRYGYAFRKIPLTQGKYAKVDQQDYERLNKYKWYAKKSNRIFYAARNDVRKKTEKRKAIWMHREILPVPEGKFADHINHNGLDNRRANLRAATRAENIRNRLKVARKTSSKYKGVTWSNSNKKWEVGIGINYKRKHIGCFKNEKEAAKEYDAAARKYHGEFAKTNF